jgi:hypothetical protein
VAAPSYESLKIGNKSQSIFHFPFDIFHLSLPELDAPIDVLAPVTFAMTPQPGGFLPNDK